MSDPSNPFDRFELDPASDLAAITEALRERAENVSPAERPALRSAWEALTLHPRRRLELALQVGSALLDVAGELGAQSRVLVLVVGPTQLGVPGQLRRGDFHLARPDVIANTDAVIQSISKPDLKFDVPRDVPYAYCEHAYLFRSRERRFADVI